MGYGIDDMLKDGFGDSEDGVVETEFIDDEYADDEETVSTISADDIEEVKPSVVVYIDDDDDDNSNGSSTLSYEESKKMFSDTLMASLFSSKDIALRNKARDTLLSWFSADMFRDENFILFSILDKNKSRLKDINIDDEFVSLYLEINRDEIEKFRDKIDINAYGEVDGSVTLGYISGVIKHFTRLKGMTDITEEDFDLSLEKYIALYRALEAKKILEQGNRILIEGMKVGNKTLVGFEDSTTFVKRGLAYLEGVLDRDQGSGFTSLKDNILNRKDNSRKSAKIGDFGSLEKLNEIYGGIYSGIFYQVMAPSKGGKSKFCARIAYEAMTKYRTNISVWAHEGGDDMWSAQMRAIHFDAVYNKDGAGISDVKMGVDQNAINSGDYPSKELEELEKVSAIDLVLNQDFGTMDLIDRSFNVETFVDDIKTSVKSNNSKLVVIDYLQLIETEDRVQERERIADAYKQVLTFCKKYNVAVITPAQYKQEAINSLAKEGSSGAELRTAGGSSAEVFRTPDVIFALWASTEDLKNNHMKVLSVPGRLKGAFDEIPCIIDLCACKFTSEE